MMRQIVFVCTVLSCLFLMGAAPDYAQDGGRSIKDAVSSTPIIDPMNFRCIFVGDSQIAAPNGARLRPPMRRWDLPIAGTFIGAGFDWTGQIVDIDVEGFDLLTSRELGNPGAWTWGGPRDFMCFRGYEWRCFGDIKDTNTPIATFQQYFWFPNGSQWNKGWTFGQELVARIAVRTGPSSVGVVETMARRGNFVDPETRTRHVLKQTYGYQIIEQVIPAGFRPNLDGPGVSVYFPNGVVEKKRTLFQVLGAAILRVDSREHKPLPGMIVGAMAFPGWSMDEHLGVSDSSREALIELVDANSVMIMLGHNRDSQAGDMLNINYTALVNRWIHAFLTTGHQYPAVINVVPWLTGSDWSQDYLGELEGVMRDTTQRVGGRTVSFVEFFENQIPDSYNPEAYQLDQSRVHPVNSETASRLSEDLEELIFGKDNE